MSIDPVDLSPLDLGIWYQLLVDKIYWRDLPPSYVINLYTNSSHARSKGLDYFVRDPAGNDVNLTTILDQFIMIVSLKKEYK
jgi:hypothetical protein